MAVYTKFENLQYFVNINVWQVNADGTFGTYNDGFASTRNVFQATRVVETGAAARRPNTAVVRGRVLNLTGFGNVALNKNDGIGRYSAIALTASKFSDKGYGFQSTLTYSKNRDNNSTERDTFGATSSIATPANPMDSYGYADSDRRIRVTTAAYFPVAFGIKGSINYSYSSGRPYSANFTSDTNGDTFTNDFNTANGFSRNMKHQPGIKTLDARFSREFEFTKRFRLEIFSDIFNVFNWANQRTSNTSYATSGTSTPFTDWGAINLVDRKTREVQLGARFRF
jgi:hypothetical protein